MIVLSAGHDSRFTGAGNKEFGLVEHHAALTICDLIAERFRGDPQFCLLDLDRYAAMWTERLDSLHAKVNHINQLHKIEHVDLAIELHFNACETHTGHGAEVLYWGKKGLVSHQAKKAAQIFQPLLEAFDGKYDGREIQHYATLIYLNETKCPAIILEPVFLDHPIDCRPLLTHAGRISLVDAIAEGIHTVIREGLSGA